MAGQDQIPFGRKSQHQAPLSMQNNWKFTQRNFFGSRLRDVLDNISLAEKNKCYAISFTRMEAVVALFSVLSGMPEGTVILQEESVEWKS